MKVSKNKNPDSNENYPTRVTLNNKREVLIPNSKKFGTYCSKHGCSATAVSVALQALGVTQADGSPWNPKEVANYCKKRIHGFNGSKLTIHGTAVAINMIAGRTVAKWHSNNGKRNSTIVSSINRSLRRGDVVLFEQKDPVHTVIFLGKNKIGKTLMASYGNVYKTTVRNQVNTKALHGKAGASQQNNWWYGSDGGAGWVTVDLN